VNGTEEAEATESVAQQWLALEQEKLEYLKDRDREDRRVAALLERNWLEIRSMQERRLDKEFQLELRKFDFSIGRMGNGTSSGRAVKKEEEEEDGGV
jgi:hypothetical protein